MLETYVINKIYHTDGKIPYEMLEKYKTLGVRYLTRADISYILYLVGEKKSYWSDNGQRYNKYKKWI